METYKEEKIIYILSLLKLGDIPLEKVYFKDVNGSIQKVKNYDFTFEALVTTKFYILSNEEE